MASWQISDSESYDLNTGYHYHGDDPFLSAAYKYGFTQDWMIPGLGQYQTANHLLSGSTDFRKGIGKSVQMAGFLYGMDRYVRWLNKYSGGGGYITKAQRTMMAFRPGMKLPVSPYGAAFKLMGQISLLTIYYDAMDYLINKPIAQGQSFLDGMVEWATQGWYYY